MSTEYILETQELTREFKGFVAVDKVNLKVRREAVDAFYKLADDRGWVLGETFERAVSALERELQKGD